jgi:CubicO group peptidase (beta-lactamase class C family)
MSFLHGCMRWALACSVALAGSMAWGQSWPDAHWPSQPAPASAALSALESYAFPARDEVGRSGVRSDALLVIRDGVLVYERYAAPTTASTPHLTWSMAKSLLASTLGVAYGQGLLRQDQPAAA